MFVRKYESHNFTYSHRPFGLSDAALILMDVWDGPTNPIKEKIISLAETCRTGKVEVIHCPHGHYIYPNLYSPNERIFHRGKDLCKYLQKKKVTKLLYAGFSIDECVLFRPTGIANMTGFGFRCATVRDCVEGSEFPNEKEPICWKVGIKIVETSFGGSTTLADITEEINGQS
jgi:nicotinamidase-related amidase